MTDSRPAPATLSRATPARIPRLTPHHVVQVLGELSDLLDAGCPLSRALGILQRQTRRLPIRRLVEALEVNVVNGSSLADALASTGGHFSDMHVAMVRAAEAGGFLQQTLTHIAAFGRRRLELLRRIKSALTYPLVLLLTAVGSVVFLLAYVVPRFAQVYQSAGARLPWATRFLIDVGRLVADYWWVGLVCVAACVGLVRLLLRNERVRLGLDGLLLRLPIFGPPLRQWVLAEFARCMALLLQGGVTVLASLKLASQVMGNRTMRAATARLADGVQQGEPMGRLMQADRLFSQATGEVIAIAEESGKLPAVLGRLAEQAQRRVEARLGVLMALAEPMVILLVGSLVALIVMAMLLPVLLMNTLVE